MHVAQLSIERLAEATGYVPRTIYLMEAGCTAHGKKIQPWVWHRYKLCCAAVHQQLSNGKQFEWGQ